MKIREQTDIFGKETVIAAAIKLARLRWTGHVTELKKKTCWYQGKTKIPKEVAELCGRCKKVEC